MTKTTKTSQITESEVLGKSTEEIKSERQPAEQPIAEVSEPAESAQEKPAPEPEQTKLEEAQPAEAEAAE